MDNDTLEILLDNVKSHIHNFMLYVETNNSKKQLNISNRIAKISVDYPDEMSNYIRDCKLEHIINVAKTNPVVDIDINNSDEYMEILNAMNYILLVEGWWNLVNKYLNDIRLDIDSDIEFYVMRINNNQ